MLLLSHYSIFTLLGDAISHPSNTFYLQLWVLHLMLRLVEFWLKQAVCDSQRSIGHEQHGELELGHKFTWTKRRLKVILIGPLGGRFGH